MLAGLFCSQRAVGQQAVGQQTLGQQTPGQQTPGQQALGQQALGQISSAAGTHEHAPMMVHSRPVIERLPLKVIAPADVASTNSGDVFVADLTGRAVFRVSSDGDVALIADDLDGLSRICVADGGDVFAMLNSPQSSRILHITPAGYQAEIAATPFAATGLARDRIGTLLTTNGRTGDVVSIADDGVLTVLTRLSEPAEDLVLDSLDNAIVLLGSGKIVSVGPEGNSRIAGYVPESSLRLQRHPDGSVLALGQAAGGVRETIWKLTADPAEWDRFAFVPAGTNAFAFDGLGNLVLANPDLRAVTRVISRFQVRCPHCSVPVTMIFSTDAADENSQHRRSF